MTNTPEPLQLVNVVDNRLKVLNLEGPKQYFFGVQQGFSNINWTQEQCNSYSTTAINWKFNTQSDRVILDRRIYASVQFKLTFTGIASQIGVRLLNSGYDAPRSYALSRVIQTLNAEINGSSLNINYSEVIKALLMYNTDFDLTQFDLSGTPTKLDNMQNYDYLLNSVKNPLGSYYDSPFVENRGGFRISDVVNPVATQANQALTASCTLNIYEPLFLSPFLYSSIKTEEGFINIQNIAVTMSFLSGQLNRVWSHADNPLISNFNVTTSIGPNATSPPHLLLNYLSPNFVDVSKIPPLVMYDYYRIDAYTNNQNTTFSFGQTKSVILNSVQLSQIPKSMYIYATIPTNDQNFSTCDCFHKIKITSFNYLNVSGQFGDMEDHDVYSMCVKNGLRSQTYTEFQGLIYDLNTNSNYGTVGNVIRLTSSDFSLPDSLSSGITYSNTLSIKLDITNINEKDINGRVSGIQTTLICVYDGLITIGNNTMISQTAVINSEQVLQTRENGAYMNANDVQQLYGGNFFDKLKSLGSTILNKVLRPLKPVFKNIPALAPVVDVAEKFGYGGAMAIGGELLSKGGKMLSKKEMKKRLK